MRFIKLLILSTVIIFLSCAGEVKSEPEEFMAYKADLIEHSGDTGNIVKNSQGEIIDTLNCYYSEEGIFYGREYNGIDAYFEGDWIYVPWQHITDPQTAALELFRFSYDQYQAQEMDSLQSVAYIPYNTYADDYYIDTFSDISDPANTTWFYYLKTTSISGAIARSDTVGYKLVNKPVLIQPGELQEFAVGDSIIFEWDPDTSNSYVQDRLLIFDQNYNLVWYYNLAADEEALVNFSLESNLELESGNYIWRVDAVIDYYDVLYIDGKYIEVYSGAESMERSFSVIE